MGIPGEREQQLIDAIVQKELEMFLEVDNLGGPAGCQQRPESFQAMRWMTHSVFPADYLESWLGDLETAGEQGINLMTVKYGRMDDLIPRENHSPLVEAIADIECKWMQELRQESPESFRAGDGEGFRRYLSCELETLSQRTLDIYQRVVTEAVKQGRNLARERYENFKTRFKRQEDPAGE
jgi:hypothetical protein